MYIKCENYLTLLPAIISKVNEVFIDILRLAHWEEVESILDQRLDQTEEEQHGQEPSVGKIGHRHSGIATNPLVVSEIKH